MLDPDAKKKIIARGLDASPGAATGRVVFHSDEAQELAERGENVILVRMETSPEDIQGMTVSTGILTSRGKRGTTKRTSRSEAKWSSMVISESAEPLGS